MRTMCGFDIRCAVGQEAEVWFGLELGWAGLRFLHLNLRGTGEGLPMYLQPRTPYRAMLLEPLLWRPSEDLSKQDFIFVRGSKDYGGDYGVSPPKALHRSSPNSSRYATTP
ncbi:hypothetical protein DPEC_G00308740 [Dallia pectoralis]|uniref:Uncharacterized protein n=1 Tax=Dallia pectoralis TaxID=75939 RepID=A0ACC2FEQ3_DALPE|nr:hypothetical protein DPEC_G00308740 [Dallia pectoralis]